MLVVVFFIYFLKFNRNKILKKKKTTSYLALLSIKGGVFFYLVLNKT